MAKFAKTANPREQAKRQCINVLKRMNEKSLGTDRNYGDSLVQLAEYANEHLHCSLKDVTVSQINQYITERSLIVGQKTIDKDRLACQSMLKALNRADYKIPKVMSQLKKIESCRAYTAHQIQLIVQHQQEKNALATLIAADAGLRAHELLTLRRIEERKPDHRDKYLNAQALKFTGREGERYTVHGKGGLIREVMLSKPLAERLEASRLSTPVLVVDRKIYYHSYYNIGGGKNLSNSFYKASMKALTWSRGIHGVRHSYAQTRLQTLLTTKIKYQTALQIVSQELGHFRAEIALVYLR